MSFLKSFDIFLSRSRPSAACVNNRAFALMSSVKYAQASTLELALNILAGNVPAVRGKFDSCVFSSRRGRVMIFFCFFCFFKLGSVFVYCHKTVAVWNSVGDTITRTCRNSFNQKKKSLPSEQNPELDYHYILSFVPGIKGPFLHLLNS